MIKRISAILLAATLMFSPLAEAGSFSGGGAKSSPAPSVSKPSVSTPSVKSSTTVPSNSTYSSKGSFSGGSSTTNSPSTPSGTYSSKGGFSGGSSTNTPVTGNSNIRSSYTSNQPYVNGQRVYSWSSPSSFTTGLASGVLLSSLIHPWGYHSGTMVVASGGYYQPSIIPLILDLVFLAGLIVLGVWLYRRYKNKRRF